MSSLKDQILGIANRHITDDKHFIVDVVISANKGPCNKVLIFLDGDEGVSIDHCAELSRVVSSEIEENNLIEEAYRIEVSSPGVDYPLTMGRQFKKNIGRDVKVTLNDGKDLKGKLKNYDDKNLTVEFVTGKKKETEAVEIPLSNIKKTIVQISFK